MRLLLQRVTRAEVRVAGSAVGRIDHGLAVLVGVGTVLEDDPQLTVRMVPGTSPMRVVLDTTLRTPDSALILGTEAATTIMTTEWSPASRRDELRERGVRIEVVPSGRDGVDLLAALAILRETGTTSTISWPAWS